jgi:hypothetical protein
MLIAAPGTALAARHKRPTHAEIAKALHQSKSLWATVNICDTAGHPNEIGIRGSMPGTGERGEMWMRFQIQYQTAADKAWHPVAAKWVKVGSARYRVRQTGYTFTFAPPADGSSWTMRGDVIYQWRVRGRVSFREERHTTGGHTNAAGGDPAHSSARLCLISPP